MDLTAKLQIKPGQTVAAVGVPDGVPPLGDAANPAAEPGAADAVVAFVRNRAELDTGAAPPSRRRGSTGSPGSPTVPWH
jgi:hypothetical protein